jgi:hypothetical protein
MAAQSCSQFLFLDRYRTDVLVVRTLAVVLELQCAAWLQNLIAKASQS